VDETVVKYNEEFRMEDTIMTRDEFIAEYYKVSSRINQLSQRARKEGLLVLEELIDFEKVNQRDILEYGIRFVVDGTDGSILDRLLSLIIEQEEDKYIRRLMEIKKEAVLQLQAGLNPRTIAYLLNAFTDIKLTDDPIIQKYKDEEDDEEKCRKEEIDAIIGDLI
jgi:flagellar motor component MotA